ncbi:hypothetical protein Dimus_011254 [Dionaea muscipula]
MDGFEEGSTIRDAIGLQGSVQFGHESSEGAVFDASQYAFFGNDAVEEVELGGLEDEEEDIPTAGLEEYPFDQEETARLSTGYLDLPWVLLWLCCAKRTRKPVSDAACAPVCLHRFLFADTRTVMCLRA